MAKQTSYPEEKITGRRQPKGGGETPPLISPELFISAILTDHSLKDIIRDALKDNKAVAKILKNLDEGEPVKGW
jgi:hypothetical protein